MLIAKDWLRDHLVTVSNGMAERPTSSALWVKTLGRPSLSAIEAAQVLFIHIPKAGGTSISKCLYGRNLPHYTADFYQRVYGPLAELPPSFAVVRHPVERLVSAYKMARAGGTNMVAYNRRQRLRLRGLDYFGAFVDFVFDNRRALSRLPSELRLQASYIIDGTGAIIVDRLYSLDDRRGFTPGMAAWLDIPAVPRINTTDPQPIFVSREMNEKIREIYRPDFEIYDALIRAQAGGSAHSSEAPGGAVEKQAIAT